MYCQYTYNMVGVIKVKTEVLRMLKETDDYLSGQEICERLNVSRTAVWRAASTAGGLEKIFYILTRRILLIPRSRKRRRKMPRTVRWQSRIISRWERDAAEEAGRRRMASASG